MMDRVRPKRAFGTAAALLCLIWLTGVVTSARGAQAPAQRKAAQESAAPAPHDADMLKRYCFTCHNNRLKTAELSLETLDQANVAKDAATWEKVLKKLRSGAMPPVGRPRPDAATYAAYNGWLEGALDGAAKATPRPGRPATFHRLNRVEYQNAVRDILGLEIDAAALLPGDDAAFGFDNIGEMLTVSPDLLDR
jgi:cytochrome c5